MAGRTPSASYSLTLRIEIPSGPGSFARVASAIADAGGDLGAIDLVRVTKEHTVRDITVAAADAEHGQRIVDGVGVDGVTIQHVSDRTFLMHLGGKIESSTRCREDARRPLDGLHAGRGPRLPGHRRDPSKAWALTIKRNTVAVVTDGTAVLGLGDIGPEAAMPVMEGKAMLFKEFAGIDALPLCLDTKDPDEIVAIVKAIAPGFGGINLEDIAAPRCFEIEGQLRHELDIPVFHDDQHGTAVVVLAACSTRCKLVGKRTESEGGGRRRRARPARPSAGILLAAGARNIVVLRPRGRAVRRASGARPASRSRYASTPTRRAPRQRREALSGRRRVHRRVGPGRGRRWTLRRWPPTRSCSRWPTRRRRCQPEEVARFAAIIATGRSDYPNQINNVLASPASSAARSTSPRATINEAMKLAAARAIAAVIPEDELHEEYIIPSVFNKAVVEHVAAAVADAAIRTGVAQRDTDSIRSQQDPSGIYG